ncbi:hypothetical protein [Solemya velum gill symbiont]|uniref:hypothetical protein n=1 Tax=Solemya velum gill symbiont TaxID=2340 RepID=UPI00117A5DD5|nr:hypothetical protein [Solemya velum gill symbiont]
MRKSTETLTRQWNLLKLIPSYPRMVSTSDLHQLILDEGFEVEKRTTERDLDNLSRSFPLSVETSGRTNMWFWTAGAASLEIPSMSPTTALMVKLAESYLTPLLPSTALTLLTPYFERAESVLAGNRY